MNKTIQKIAKRRFTQFDTLETRRSDSLDFRDVAVWQVKAGLEDAFKAGKLAGARQERRRLNKAYLK